MPLGTWPSTESPYRMNTFIEIVFRDPITDAPRKRIVSTDGIVAIDADASSGMALVVLGGKAQFPAGAGGSRLMTYEAYGDVAARLAQATPGNPTVVVSPADQARSDQNVEAVQSLRTAQAAQPSA